MYKISGDIRQDSECNRVFIHKTYTQGTDPGKLEKNTLVVSVILKDISYG